MLTWLKKKQTNNKNLIKVGRLNRVESFCTVTSSSNCKKNTVIQQQHEQKSKWILRNKEYHCATGGGKDLKMFMEKS